MSKKIKVKTPAGKIIELPANTVKRILSDTGYSGNLLLKATNNTFKEAKKLAKGGVVTATNFEKAIIKAISNTNRIAMDTTQKLAKKILK